MARAGVRFGLRLTDDATVGVVGQCAVARSWWLTNVTDVPISKKRAAYRKAFADFDPRKVARFTPQRIAKLLANPGMIRNKLKVNAASSLKSPSQSVCLVGAPAQRSAMNAPMR